MMIMEKNNKYTTLNNTFVIGDVHGCYHTLIKLVKKLPKNANIIFLGDLCDKGNFSKEVLEFVINNNHTCIYGNHEFLFYNYARDAILRDIHKMWSTNDAYGGAKTVRNYGNDYNLLHKHIKWIETLPKYLLIDNYFLTHGFGLAYFKRRDKKKYQKSLYVNRITNNDSKKDWEDYSNYDVINIFGHCIFNDVLIGKNYYGIDTGCYNGGKLTALNLGTKEIYNMDAVDIDIKKAK